MKACMAMMAAAAIIGSVARAGESGSGQLSAEQFLPLAENRHAYEPAAAWGGDVFLVVWKSGHLGEGDLRKEFNYVGDLAACRLDKSGKVLDAKPLTVSAAGDLQERPRITFGGGNFLVVWQDYRNGKDPSTSSGHGYDVYAARVTPDGKVLDSDGILVAGGAHNQALPNVAWDGKVFQVVWQDYRSGTRYEIFGARVTPDGKVLDPDGKLLASDKAPSSRYGPVTAANAADGKSLLFWRGTSNNRKQPIAGCLWIEGCAVAGEPYVTADNRTAPGGGAQANFPMCLAAGPDGFLGAWTTNVPIGRGNAANDAHAAVFGKDGKLKKTFLLWGQGGVSGGRIRNPAAVWTGSRFLVAWDQYDAKAAKAAKAGWPVEVVCAEEVDAEGNVTAPMLISGTANEPAILPAVASDGAGTSLIVYEKHPGKADGSIRIGARIATSK